MNPRLSAALVLALALSSPAAAGGEGDPPPAKPAPAAPAGAPAEDVLVLKGGGEVRGRIAGEDDAAYAVKVGGALRIVEKSDVAEVRRGTPPAEPAPGTPGEGEAKGGGEPGKAPGAGAGKGAGKGKGKGGGKGGEAGKRRRPEAPAGEGAPAEGAPVPVLSDAARGWAKTCLERLLDGASDPAVRRSAAEALRALGPAVKPVLEEARASAGEEGRGVIDRLTASLGAPRPGDAPPPGEGGARKPPGGAGRAGKGGGGSVLERVRTELGLDEAGARAVGGKLLEFGREMRTTMEDARDGLITYEEARTKISGQRARLRDALAGTLSAEQQAKLDALLDGLAPGRKR